MSLTAAQREAISSWQRGDVCVVAGPGSGKTRVLVERIRWLAAEKRVEAGEILAITFTKKAAASLRGRLVEAARDDQALRRDLERTWISTIDAFCARLLRENAIAARVDPDFQVLEPSDAERELQAAIDEALNEAFDADPEMAARFLGAFQVTAQPARTGCLTRIHQDIGEALQAFRGMGREPFERAQPDHPFPTERGWALAVAKDASSRYEERKQRLGRLDFPDLTTRAIQLLQSGAPLPQRFRHILVDENQDTNPLQESLLRNLQKSHGAERPTLFAVGDLNQSIYAFRDAKPEVFSNYRRRIDKEGGHPVELLENFRSRLEILAFAEALTAKAPGLDPRRLEAKRQFAPKAAPSVEVLLTCSKNPLENEQKEAQWIAHRILELRRTLRISERPGGDGPVREREAHWGDFAILTRTHPRLDAFSEALRQAGVPYQRSGGRGFLEAEEVRDLLGFLRLLDNPRDEIRLAAALRSPLGGVDENALIRLKSDGRNLAEALRRPGQHPRDELAKLKLFQARLDDFRRQREDVRPDVLLARIVAETGYEAWLLRGPGGAHRAANLAKLAALAGRADDGESSYAEIIERIARRQGPGDAEADDDAVRLMTLHAAKGLEFPVVVMASVQAGPDKKNPALLASADQGLGGRWLTGDGATTKDAAYTAAEATRKQTSADEEDRLFYVGMTRAEEHLILSAGWGDRTPQKRNGPKRLAAFGMDLGAVDEQPHEVELHGCRIRLFRTWEAPPAAAATPLEAERSQPVLLQPLPDHGQADGVAAVTSVALFDDCPRKYYLSRYLGLDGTPAEPEPSGEISAADLGLRVHEILAGAADPGDGEAAELARVFSESPLGRRAALAEEISRERRMLFPVGERLLRGVVDLVFSDDEGRVLVDYKTDRVSTAEAPERSAAYALQLQLYALALEGAGERPDRAVLHFLRPDTLVEVDLSPPALESARGRVEALFAAHESQQFELKPAPRCRRCPYYQGLCQAELPESPETGTQYSLF